MFSYFDFRIQFHYSPHLSTLKLSTLAYHDLNMCRNCDITPLPYILRSAKIFWRTHLLSITLQYFMADHLGLCCTLTTLPKFQWKTHYSEKELLKKLMSYELYSMTRCNQTTELRGESIPNVDAGPLSIENASIPPSLSTIITARSYSIVMP